MTRPARRPRWRSVAVAAVLALLASACAGPARSGDPPTPSGSSGAVDGSAREAVPSALRQAINHPSLPKPLVDPGEVTSGGPPPDGIPAVDRPKFVSTGAVDWLAGDEPVIALEIAGRQRAYPVQIMIWHEIVNDQVAGTPVAVTYCPLCNSALAFERRRGDRLLTFGVSGFLYRSDLVMYDRQTESLWSQIEGRAIAGHLTGQTLTRVPVQTITWDQWRQAHPGGTVLSRDTGVDRDYGRNPYLGCDKATDAPFAFSGEPDPRLAPKERVLGLGDTGRDPTAVVLSGLARKRVIALTVNKEPVVVWAAGGLRSALDTKDINAGRRVAATGAFNPVVSTRHLTFAAAGPDTFTDQQSGSTWNILGRAVAGPMAGKSLKPVGHLDTFWFAWAAFHPDTRLVNPAG